MKSPSYAESKMGSTTSQLQAVQFLSQFENRENFAIWTQIMRICIGKIQKITKNEKNSSPVGPNEVKFGILLGLRNTNKTYFLDF